MKPRLKALELHGYKTFAGRALFEFPGNITAIVGPNGSGKSNIADAIRWVLGEQSYNLLRGKKTEDMIFLGSDQRPKAGMASATITFNNDDNWLPIDFSEVGVSRRAYRDGSNEYLLNKQKVRLKDISELLAQSGLAERTYTIIGQGAVDDALSLRPEERRRFFEEAAGIGLFRSRREESLSRLDATRRNLERVTDILGELEPRLKSLERQAKRMEEYDRVKADLHVLLKDWYGFHWQNTQKELLRNKEILKNQEEKVTIARQKRTETEERVTYTRTRLQELRALLNQWHAESAEFHLSRENVSKEVAVLEERLRAYNDQRAVLTSELLKAEEESRNHTQTLESYSLDKARSELEIEESRQQLQNAQLAHSSRQIERNKIEMSISQERKRLIEVETQQVQLKAHQRELHDRLENMNTSQVTLNAGITKNLAEIQENQLLLDKAKAHKLDKDTLVVNLELELAKTRATMTDLEEKISFVKNEIGQKNAEVARINAQLVVITQAEQSMMGLGEGTKTLLSASRSGKLTAKMKSINQVLDVPEELEVAISAALGDLLEAVIFGDEEESEAVLNFIIEEDSGRAVLVPSIPNKKGEKLKLLQVEGVLGIASDLVKGREQGDELVSFLLNQVVIVRDRAIARQLLKGLHQSGRIVTLNGEVFNADGTIIAGKEKRTGIISQPRQRKDLEIQSGVIQKQLGHVNSDLAGLQNSLDGVQTSLKRLSQSLREKVLARDEAGSKLDLASRNIAQLNQKLDWQNSQVSLVKDQVNKTEEEIQLLVKEIDARGSSIARLTISIKESDNMLRAIPIDELQTQLVHWNTSVAVNDRTLQEAERRYTEFEQILRIGEKRITSINERIALIDSYISTTESNREVLIIQKEEVNQQIGESQKKIEPAELELNDLEVKYSQQQHEYSILQQAEANTDRVYSQALLELSRSHESLENLRRRIEEDFGLVAFEYSEDITGPTPLPLEGVNQLVVIAEIPRELEDSINRQRALIRRMGAINPDAQKEYGEVKERFDFLTSQSADLKKADADLRQIITELDELMHRQFRTTFNAVAAEFKVMFSRLFGGGSAKLVMTDDENPTETGIDIEAKLPGRREQGLSLLSGGERSLTAVALIFSLLRVSPTPFCVLDEVDAALDEANVGKFTELLKELSQETQFILITHNRNTVQAADVIYGVTMGRDSVSQVISLRLDEVSDEIVK